MPSYSDEEFDKLVRELAEDEEAEAEVEGAEESPEAERRAILQKMVDEGGPDAALALQLLDAADERSRQAELAAVAAEAEELERSLLEFG